MHLIVQLKLSSWYGLIQFPLLGGIEKTEINMCHLLVLVLLLVIIIIIAINIARWAIEKTSFFFVSFSHFPLLLHLIKFIRLVLGKRNETVMKMNGMTDVLDMNPMPTD